MAISPLGLPSPTVVGGGNVVCLTGVVNLFQFILPPQPGSVIGTLRTFTGQQVNLVQTSPGTASGVPLSSVDGSVATVCGVPTLTGALDVRFVSPGAGGGAFPQLTVQCFLVPTFGGLGFGGLGGIGLGGGGLGGLGLGGLGGLGLGGLGAIALGGIR